MRYALLLLLFCSGCAPFTQVQIDLVDQASRGIGMTRKALDERLQLVERLHELQRKRIDEAFDADVRTHQHLDGEWVIEHRRAYAAALDALAVQQLASQEAETSDRRTLDAVEQALAQLRALQSIQLKWSHLPEVSHEH